MMSCPRIHDFVAGTAIALPRPTAQRRGTGEIWDILRPNERAASLVARHLLMLAAMAGATSDNRPTQTSPLSSASSCI